MSTIRVSITSSDYSVAMLELMDGQATPYTPKESTIISRPVTGVLRAWWNLAPQKT